jgi:hypothetical protein
VKPLIAAEATTFVLIQKVAKNQVSRFCDAIQIFFNFVY